MSDETGAATVPTVEWDASGEPAIYARVLRELAWRSIRGALPQQGARVLDVGPGTTEWAIGLARTGCEVTVVEPSRERLRAARRRLQAAGVLERVTLGQAEITDLSLLPDASQDMVVAQGQPLSYCADAATGLRELARVCQPGAPLVGSVGNRWRAPVSTAFAGGGPLDIGRAMREGRPTYLTVPGPTVMRGYDVAEIRALAEACGWRDVHVRGRGVFVPMIGPGRAQALAATEEGFEHIIEMELATAAEPTLIGAALELELTAERGAARTTVRTAGPDDFETLFALYRAVFAEHGDGLPPVEPRTPEEEPVLEQERAELLRRMEAHQALTVLAEVDGLPVGFAIAYEEPQDCWLHWRSGVLGSHRRRGIGRDILRAQIAAGTQRGLRRMRYAAPNSSHEMIILGMTEGFQIVGSEADRERGETVVWMERVLQ